MASRMSLQSQEKASRGATNQHGKNLQDTELTDDLLYRVLSLEQDFIQFLKPSDVMYDIQGLDGELIDVLDTLKICGNLYQNGCLELRDKEEIVAVHSRSGRTASCKRLFQIVRRRKANWAFLFIAAIKESQEYVKCKMDPSSTNGLYFTACIFNISNVIISSIKRKKIWRAGVLVDGNSGNPYTSEIRKAFRDITRWTAVSGENEQSDDKNNTIEKIVLKKFEIDCSITNLFACHCVFMDRLFLTDYHDNILYCCNLQGQVMWKFQGKELKELHGVTTDKHDNVYIAGAFSHNVIVISNTGTHFKELINKSDKVIQPIAIFYDKSNDCLLVCNAKGSVFL
ncbi:AASDH [Mytilus edulis]|uniref:AASDH n=1 Tax=Mytilus edulis TaxID=6550 RepID=A0A8S3UA18_MYTED|nr:AASDH [Mytilus edulis]